MKQDCFGNNGVSPVCKVLNEKLCERGDGFCPFYKTLKQAADDRVKASEALAKKGLRPVVKKGFVDGEIVPIQTTEKIHT